MRWLAGEQWASLKDLPEDQQLLVVTVAQEFQHWALVERVCEESVVQASRKLERAAFLARLGVEIAEKVRGPEGWRNRVRGYAEAHGPNVLRVAGELQAAAAGIGEAKRLWEKGEDPLEVLDPGRLLNLEGALCRDQGRFSEALAILDQAVTVGRFPELALIQKGLTLEATGEYDHAVETLFKAQTLVELREDVRLGNIVQFNLAVNLCHERRYTEAIELVHKVWDFSAQSG